MGTLVRNNPLSIGVAVLDLPCLISIVNIDFFPLFQLCDGPAVVVGAVSVVAVAVTFVAAVDVDVTGGGRVVDVLCAAATPTPVMDPEVQRLKLS